MSLTKNRVSKFIYFLVTLIFFIVADFYLSNLVVKAIHSGHHFSSVLVNFHYVKNTGAAFSLLQNSTFLLIVLSVIAFFLILVYTIRNIKSLSMRTIFWISLLGAGIYCNMYERIVYGYVRDFFQLTFIDFPVFNISDIFISIAVAAIVVKIVNKNFVKIL